MSLMELEFAQERHAAVVELLAEVLAELKSIRAALATSARSSVELKTAGQKGAVDGKIEIAIKAYGESPIDEALIEAVGGFRTAINEVRRGQMDDWASTLDMVRADREAQP